MDFFNQITKFYQKWKPTNAYRQYDNTNELYSCDLPRKIIIQYLDGLSKPHIDRFMGVYFKR